MALALGLATPASAAPAAKLIMVEVENYEMSFANALPVATEEPGGLLVPPDAAKEWLELGLLPGDVIRFKDGTPAQADFFYVSDGITVIDLIRNGKPVVLHILAHGKSASKAELTADQFKDLEDTLAKDQIGTAVQHGGTPSGVRITEVLLGIYLRLDVGDLVRTVDGVAVRTNAELVAALQHLRIGTSTILVDRNDRPVTIRVTRLAPLDLTKIHITGRDHAEVPRALVTALAQEPQLVTQGAQVVAVEHDGKLTGHRLFAIEPTSVAARLGIQNEDIVVDIDGKSIDSREDAYKVDFSLGSADSIKIRFMRKGKPHDLVVAITD